MEKGKYNVMIINPEILMGNDDVEKLWKKPEFTKRLLNFVFDEGHCISQWGSFRKEYAHLGALCYLIQKHVPFYVASATLPLPILLDITDILQLRLDKTEQIFRSNDRPEISLMVRGLVSPANSFQDLAFLIPDNFQEGDTVDPFLVFFNGKKEAENACKALRKRLPVADQQKIKWLHADLTQEEREILYEEMKTGEVFSLFCTDAFGMVSYLNPICSNELTFDKIREWTYRTSKSLSSGKRLVVSAHCGNDLVEQHGVGKLG